MLSDRLLLEQFGAEETLLSFVGWLQDYAKPVVLHKAVSLDRFGL